MAQFDTNPGSQSSAELEREVTREREHVADTIDALQRKASVGNIVDQVVKAVSENGGDVSRNLGRQLRDNPLPVLLTGVGLAWLMAGGGPSARRDDGIDWDPVDRPVRRSFNVYDEDPLAVEEETYGVLDAPEYPASAGSDYTTPRTGYETGDETSGGVREGVGYRERAGAAAGSARDKAADLRHGASDRLSSAGDALRGAGHAAGERFRQAGGSVRHAGHSARSGIGRAGHSALAGIGRAGHDVGDALDDLMQDQPLVLGALALAVGAAFGGAIPSSRAEDRMFGAQSDRLKQGARDMAEAEGQKAVATATAVADEAATIAGETVEDVNRRIPEASDVADRAGHRVEDAADRLRQAGKSEAERQHLGEPGSKAT
jgi:Protein of unknown function (DUF3618)